MPSAANFRAYAMPYIGQQNVAAIPANASTRMLQCLNQTLQEIFRNEHQETLSAQVRGPTSITLGQVTQGSTAVTFAGYQPWMQGCTLRISGDALSNAFDKRNATLTLRSPYQGPTQTDVPATIYQDSIVFDSEIKQIYPPVKLNDQYYVEPLPDRSSLEMSRTVWRSEYSAVPKTGRRPQWYILEDALAYNTTPGTRMEFDSLPDANYTLTLEARLRAPRVADWNDSRDYFIPGQEDESILYPWALGKFLSWPQFIGDSAVRAQVAADAGAASQQWAARSKGFTPTAISMDY